MPVVMDRKPHPRPFRPVVRERSEIGNNRCQPLVVALVPLEPLKVVEPRLVACVPAVIARLLRLPLPRLRTMGLTVRMVPRIGLLTRVQPTVPILPHKAVVALLTRSAIWLRLVLVRASVRVLPEMPVLSVTRPIRSEQVVGLVP